MDEKNSFQIDDKDMTLIVSELFAQIISQLSANG